MNKPQDNEIFVEDSESNEDEYIDIETKRQMDILQKEIESVRWDIEYHEKKLRAAEDRLSILSKVRFE